MIEGNGFKTAHVYAKIAGVLYLIIIVFGIFSEVFVRSSLIEAGDAAETATNILSATSFFRTGFVSDVIMVLSDVAIAVIFYQLFKPVSSTLSLMAAVFRLIQAAILGVNLLNYYAAILILTNTGETAPIVAEQSNSLALFYLNLHSHGYDLGLIFFGLSNLILGYLVIKSGYFPGILGYGLQAAAVVYLVGSFTLFLLPHYASLIQPIYIIPLLAEVSFCFWLLIAGVNKPGSDHS